MNDRDTYNRFDADPVAASDRRVLIADDPWADGLTVVPVAQAEADAGFIRALRASTTVEQVRGHAGLWALICQDWEDWDSGFQYDDDGQRLNPDEVPGDRPYDPEEWFGVEGWIYWLPLARLRTAETAPDAVDPFWQADDTEPGMASDYVPAPWLRREDRDRIEAALVAAGYAVVHDDALAQGYTTY